MPRTARAIEAGMVYHVLNRGNAGRRLFEEPAEYGGFEEILAEGLQRYPVALLTYCLMPNHWHLVVQPKTDDAVGRLLGWVGVTHVRRYHAGHRRQRGGDGDGDGGSGSDMGDGGCRDGAGRAGWRLSCRRLAAWAYGGWGQAR